MIIMKVVELLGNKYRIVDKIMQRLILTQLRYSNFYETYYIKAIPMTSPTKNDKFQKFNPKKWYQIQY